MQQIAMELSGSALKQRGQAVALDHADYESPGWSARTIEALRIFCDDLKRNGHITFTFEQFRATRSHDLPVSHKAWGSVPRIAVAKGIISWTGQYQNAKSLKTHAHPIRVWRIL